jgi:small-conductance mechanosensitive channel
MSVDIVASIRDALNRPIDFLGGSNPPTYGDVLTFFVILIAAFIIARIIRMYISRSFRERMPKTTLNNINKLVYYGILTVAFLAALPLVGFSLSGLFVAGGILGIVLGFASQTVVANLISGLFLVVEKPMKLGDTVEVDGEVGIVKDIRILSTTIRTFDGIYTRIPNEKVFNSHIKNHVAHGARRFTYTVGIRYRDDATRAVETIKNLLDQHPFILKNPAPAIYVEELGESSVNLSVRIWSPSIKWWDVYTEMLWKIKVALEQEGIEVPFPQRVVWMTDKGS